MKLATKCVGELVSEVFVARSCPQTMRGQTYFTAENARGSGGRGPSTRSSMIA